MAGLTPPDLHSLPLFHRIAGTQVVVLGDGDMAAAKRRLIERAGGVCCTEAETHEARLAFVALEDPAAAEAAAQRLKQGGLMVNVADRPELCDFTLPSVLERGDVLVAVSTGGASAGLAKQLRLRLEALLPSSLGTLAAALAGARGKLRERWPDAAARRHALDQALSEGGPLDPLASGAPDALPRWLSEAAIQPADRAIEVVISSDDPDELTLHQARLLGMADIIVHDPAISPAILARARNDAVRIIETSEFPPGSGLTVFLRRAPER